MLLGFLHFQKEVEQFGSAVLPLVREMEAQARASGDVATAHLTGPSLSLPATDSPHHRKS